MIIRTSLFSSSASSPFNLIQTSHLCPQNDNVHELLRFCTRYPWPLLQAILISRALPFLFAEHIKSLSSDHHHQLFLPRPLGLGEAPARRVSSPLPGVIVAMCLRVNYIRILNPSLAARCSYHLLCFVSSIAHLRSSGSDGD